MLIMGGGTMKLKGKLILLVFLIIVFLSVSILTGTYIQVKMMAEHSNKSMLDSNGLLTISYLEKKYSGDWRIDGEKLYKGTKLLNGDEEFVDEVKSKANSEATIFLNDTRIATTVLKDGKRAIGTKASKEVIETVLKNGNEFIGDVEILEKPYKVKYIPLKDSSGAIVGMFFMGIEQSIINKQINALMFTVFMVTIIIAIVASLIMVLFTQGIIKPLQVTINHLEIISKGDLSADVPLEFMKRKDEVGSLAKSLNLMQMSVKSMLHKIQTTSYNIETQSENLSAISEEMANSAQNVATTIDEVATATGSEAEDLSNISSILTEFGNTLNEMRDAIGEINTSSKGVNSMALESNDKMQNLIQSVETVSGSFNNFSKVILRLGADINRINEITAVIDGIADQTNLLALNAAIEAARAGEFGKGFAVVAQEIRKLAEQSKTSSGNINGLIEMISGNTKEIISDSDRMNQEITMQIEVIDSSIKSFNKIINAVQDIVPKIELVNNSATNINKEKNIIMEKIEVISAIAEEVSASAEEISATSQEMNAASEEVAASAQSFTQMTKEMIEDINKFKL
jgi:methyl-accepting chemotaxis protein